MTEVHAMYAEPEDGDVTLTDRPASGLRAEVKCRVIAALQGVRGMAEIERISGSLSWARALSLIDDAIEDVRVL